MPGSPLNPRNWQHSTAGPKRVPPKQREAATAPHGGAPAIASVPAANGSYGLTNGAGAPAASPLLATPPELLERRRELAERLAEIQWDLGGLTYEMAIRDHFVLEVLVRRAAELQEVDAQLAEVERMLRMEDAGAAGECPQCRALHSRGAVFCWQCGHQLLETAAAP